MAQQKTFKLEEFKPSNLVYNQLTKREGQKQKLAFISCKHGDSNVNPSIQTGVVDIVCRGLPAPATEGRPEPGAYINFPIDVTQPDGKRLYDHLIAIDEEVGSNDWKQKYLGEKKYADFAYISLVRTPKEDDSDSEDEGNSKKKKSSLPKLPYVKAKFMTARDNDKIITTPMFLRTFGSKEPKVKLENVNTIEGLRKIIRLGSKLRAVLAFSKVWSGMIGSDKKYGVGLKIVGLEIESGAGSSNAEYRDSGGFLSESDDDNDAPIASSLSKTNKAAKPVDDGEDGEDDNDDAHNHNQSDDESDNNFKKPAAPAAVEEEGEEETSPVPDTKKSKSKGRSSKSRNNFD